MTYFLRVVTVRSELYHTQYTHGVKIASSNCGNHPYNTNMTFQFYRILGCDTVWLGNSMPSSQMKVLSADRGKSQQVGGRLGCDAEESEPELSHSSERQSE